MRSAVLTALAALALAVPAHAQDAQPDPTLLGPTTPWQICNETSYVVRTASAYLRGGRMAAKGWTEILPGACTTEITPVDSPRFLFAESSDVHQGGVREWKGETPLCADTDDFTSDATEDCRLANRQTRDYFAVRPGEPVTTLVEPAGYTRKKAVIAATQRLLRDAGFEVSRVDGLTGRRTSGQLRTFRKQAELPANTEGEPLLRALMAAARTAKQSVGLEVCNESTRPIFAAVATKTDGDWRSRGWWRAEPGECTRPLDTPLPGTDAHVFALQAGEGDAPDRRLRTVSDNPAQFCIAESRFDALGNEYCADKGYGIGSFRAVPTETPGARMRLSDGDFSDPAPLGLRR